MRDSFKELIKELKVFFAPEMMYFNLDGSFVKCRMVATAEKLQPMCGILEKFFKAPFKPAGVRPPRELGDLEIIQDLNGIRTEQTLYLDSNDSDCVYFAAIWPWQSDPSQASLFYGLHFSGADSEAKKTAMTTAKADLEAISKGSCT